MKTIFFIYWKIVYPQILFWKFLNEYTMYFEDKIVQND